SNGDVFPKSLQLIHCSGQLCTDCSVHFEANLEEKTALNLEAVRLSDDVEKLYANDDSIVVESVHLLKLYSQIRFSTVIQQNVLILFEQIDKLGFFHFAKIRASFDFVFTFFGRLNIQKATAARMAPGHKMIEHLLIK
uniref:Uncharacterized protein n=1 Tax=Romanomermis culicivorax TaxID=13658 RepID=A0A915J0V7_ROMCU